MTRRKPLFLIFLFMLFSLLLLLEQYGYLNLRSRPVDIMPQVSQQPLSEIRSDISVEVNDLLKVVYALELYRLDHWSYPVSSHKGRGWDGVFSTNGESREDWIQGLVPAYIEKLPRDRRLLSDGTRQYLYSSNGVSYKLLAHNADNCSVIKAELPSLVDPVRDCFAYGFWTKNYTRW